LTFKISAPNPIGVLLRRMLAAIGFDDELCFDANEVNDVRTKRNLALEFETVHLTIA
jgi:hypothetical protein